MRERRIFVTQDEIFDETIIFSPANLHYLKNVLHFRSGDQLTMFDGERRYEVVLEQDQEGELIGKICTASEENPDFPVKVRLAFGCVRPGPTDEIIRHGTELGVESFFPLILERSTRRPETARARWGKIAASACAQSGRTIMPKVHDPMKLEAFLEVKDIGSCLIYLAPDQIALPLGMILDVHASDCVTLLVGTEGGLTEQEESLLAKSGFLSASLGPTILKTETAAIVAAGIVLNWGLVRSSA